MRNTCRRLFLAALAAALWAGTGATWAHSPNQAGPGEPPPGTRADRREDLEEVQQLRQQVQMDREKLQADIQQFGPRSLEARADRRQLRHDRKRLRRLRRDISRDRRIWEQR